MIPTPPLPRYSDLLWPTLVAVIGLGGSGTIDEINAKILEDGAFTEDQQSVPHGDGPRSEIEYRLAWARTYLKGIGALDNSTRGVWAATDDGRRMDAQTVANLHGEYRANLRRLRKERRQDDDEVEEGDAGDTLDWKEQLLERLLKLPSERFEQLTQRLLREAGFVSATVIGRTGDGGIDGLGVYRLSLVSFPVFFQVHRA